MAQKGIQLDSAKFCCSICLDLLKDLVTIPCGHSYCMSCIKDCWDEEEKKKIYSCPQCRQTFTSRPVLVKNTMFAELLEDMKKSGLQAAPRDLCYAEPGDVACDFCTTKKRKALKSCLMCLVSYCKQHLQPHYDIAPLKKHKLVNPSKTLQENICSHHDEVMKIFCCTDQQCICDLCSMDEHKGHDTVSAAAQRKDRQKELGVSWQKIQQRIQDREKDVKVLQQEVKEISRSADKAVEDSEKMLTELIRLIEKRRSDVKQQIRSQQKEEVSRAEELQEKLKQEIDELRWKDTELEQLSHTEDHIHFLQNYPSLSCLSQSTDSPSTNIRPLRYFEDVTAAVSEKDEFPGTTATSSSPVRGHPEPEGSESSLPVKKSAMAEQFGELFKPREQDVRKQQLVKEEVTSYKVVDCISLDSNPLEWWKTNEHKYPHVAKLAKRYLAAPATSVPSKRVFSTAGDIITAQRSVLSAHNVHMLIFLTKNIKVE